MGCTRVKRGCRGKCLTRGSAAGQVPTGTCLCDLGFYPEVRRTMIMRDRRRIRSIVTRARVPPQALDDPTPPCVLHSCPYASNVECSGHGECEGETGACDCNAHFQVRRALPHASGALHRIAHHSNIVLEYFIVLIARGVLLMYGCRIDRTVRHRCGAMR